MPQAGWDRRIALARRAWQVGAPYVSRYAPVVGRFINRAINSELFGPALYAATNIYSGEKNLDKLAPLLFSGDYTYDPAQSDERPAKRLKQGPVSDGINVPNAPNSNASDAVNGPFHPGNQAGAASQPSSGRRSMARPYRRRPTRLGGQAVRRIVRSWSGQFALRGRYRRGRAVIRPERKCIEFARTAIMPAAPALIFQNVFTGPVVSGSTGNLILLNGLEMGTGLHQRIGVHVQIVSILVRMCIQVPTGSEASPSFSQCVRVLMFKDRQANGTTPTIDAVLDTDTTTGTSVSQAMLLENRMRFKVLMDKHYVLSGASNAAEFFCEYFSKKRHSVMYTGTAGTIAEIKSNAIWLALLAPYPVGGDVTNRPHLSMFTSRIRFVDP